MNTEPGYLNKAECERLDNILIELQGVNYALRHPKAIAASEDKLRWSESHESKSPVGWSVQDIQNLMDTRDRLLAENKELRNKIAFIAQDRDELLRRQKAAQEALEG